jgi:hemerythrin
MTSSGWGANLDPSVEIMNMQLSKIYECIGIIQDGIIDTQQSCTNINSMLEQLEQLCQMHFLFEEKLLEELEFPSVEELAHLHDLFLKAINQLKTENDHCHTPDFFDGFIQLRVHFVSNMNKETMMLCDMIISNCG